MPSGWMPDAEHDNLMRPATGGPGARTRRHRAWPKLHLHLTLHRRHRRPAREDHG